MEDEYDLSEMKMRGLTFELAKLTAVSKALCVVLEWEKLKKENTSFETDYPAITELIKSNKSFLDPDNWGSKLLLDNPLIKLAFISQAPPENKENNSDSEKSPG